MIELIRMVEKHNTLITINYLALGFMNRAASMMTARSAHEDFAYRYAPHYYSSTDTSYYYFFGLFDQWGLLIETNFSLYLPGSGLV